MTVYDNFPQNTIILCLWYDNPTFPNWQHCPGQQGSYSVLIYVCQSTGYAYERKISVFTNHIRAGREELQSFTIYMGTNRCWVISFFACLARMCSKVPIKTMKCRRFLWSASPSRLRLVWTVWKCRNLSEDVQGFKYVHVITGHAGD